MPKRRPDRRPCGKLCGHKAFLPPFIGVTMHRKDPENSFTFEVTSLGCKVNQAEASWLQSRLSELGGQPAQEGQPAQVVVLLTCSVTSGAARQSRQMARRLARAHPDGRVVITGCDAQVAPDSYRSEGFQTASRHILAGLPEILAGGYALPITDGPGAFCPGQGVPGQGRSRPQLKVQDGCDAGCAYCIVPLARGNPHSLPLDQARSAFGTLARAGAAEVVLTGIHLGLYGRDLEPAVGLLDLVRALLAEHPGPRLRLSSLETSEVSDGLLELMAEEPGLCPHLHLPLQSGSDRVLKAMGRPYTAAEYLERAARALELVPGLCLGADVLVGLPGEDEEAFQETRDLIRSLDLAYLHVFPYSPRPGTRAADMERPSAAVARDRAAALRSLGKEKRLAFLHTQVGLEMEAVSEAGGLARSANYCLLSLDRAAPAGELIRVRAHEVDASGRQPLLLANIL
jgi:threonylcarbamoyladenosine tRNA methylthiotransferase MtaB